MKNKIIIMMLLLITLITASGVLAVAPTIETLPVHWVGYDAAVLSGNVTAMASTNGTFYFRYKNVDSEVWLTSSQTEFVNETGVVTLNIFNLVQDTNYTYQAMILTYSDVIVEAVNANVNFTTNKSPLLSGATSTDVTTESFTLNIDITSLGDETNVSLYADCYYDGGMFTTNE